MHHSGEHAPNYLFMYYLTLTLGCNVTSRVCSLDEGASTALYRGREEGWDGERGYVCIRMSLLH